MQRTVESRRPRCPQCRIDLARVVRLSGIRWPCRSCGGVAADLGFLQQLAVDGVATAVWTGSADEPATGPPCAFCGGALRLTPVAGVVIGVCRDCEAAWLDTDARRGLPQRGLPSEAGGGERCAACGAPWVPTSDGSCRCCYAFDGEHDPRAAGRKPRRHMTTAG